jgi:hypothetical protein
MLRARRPRAHGRSVRLKAMGMLIPVTVLATSCGGAEAAVPAAPPPPSPRQIAEQQYMAIIQNQGALIADQGTMVRLGDDACRVLANTSQIGGARAAQQLATAQFVLRFDVSTRLAAAIMTAAQGSGHCSS